MPNEDDTNANQPPESPPSEETTQEQGEERYTRAQLEEATRKARDSAYAEMRRRTEQRKPVEKQEERTAPKSEVERLARRRDALEDELPTGISSEARRWIRDRIDREDPDDPAQWIRDTVASLRLSPGESKPNNQQAPSTETKTHVEDRGAPGHVPPWERPSDPFKWSKEDIERLEAQKGRREAQRIIRRKAEEFARNLTIQVGSRR